MKTVNFFGRDAEFHHVGIAVKAIDDLVKGAEKTTDQIQNVNVAFVNINNLKVELVEPLNEASPVVNILKKQQGAYHLCFKVKNIKKAMDTARKYGFHCIAKPMPAWAFGEKKIAWLFSRAYGLVELLEG